MRFPRMLDLRRMLCNAQSQARGCDINDCKGCVLNHKTNCTLTLTATALTPKTITFTEEHNDEISTIG